MTQAPTNTDKLKFALIIFGAAAVAAYSFNFYYAYSTSNSAGTFGDTFGAANAFFSGSALIMLIYAIVLQREELELVKEERNDTRTLLEGQEGITRQQKEALSQQLFQQSFFSLVSQISDERHYLNQPLSSDSTTSRMDYATNQLQHAFEKGASLREIEDTDRMTRNCETFCSLIAIADSLLQKQKLDPIIELDFCQTLRAYINSSNSMLFVVYAVGAAKPGSGLSSTVERLNCMEHLPKKLQVIAKQALYPRPDPRRKA